MELVSLSQFAKNAEDYFNVQNVRPSVDEFGEELPDDEAAWREARLITGDLFKDINGKFRPGQQWTLEVTNEAGKPIYLIVIEGTRLE